MVEHVLKLVCDEESDSFRISVEFKEDTFNLTILQKLTAWSATIHKQNINHQAEQHEIHADEYYKKLQEYFMKSPASVNLKFNDNELVINCKLENKMQIKYFSCKLKEVDYSECVENLIDKLYTERNNSLGKLEVIEAEKNELNRSKIYFESKLNEFVEKKKTDDQELYNNFVLVLNEKKKRNQHLNELLEAFKRGRSMVNPHVEIKKHKKKSASVSKKKIEIKEEISESDSTDEYNTDEEKPKNLQELSDEDLNDINKNKKVVEPMPSTSKSGYDLFADDSPPRHLLPKRIKSETIAESTISNKPSYSNKKSEDKNKENITYNTTDETPNVNFDTQDLLDNII